MIGQEPAGRPDDEVSVRVGLALLQEEHLDSGQDEEAAEDVDDPRELLDHPRAGGDHRPAQHERPEDPPEQHPVLVERRHGEEREDHADDEDVVHGEGLLDEVSRHVLHEGRRPVVVDRPEPFDRHWAQGHQVGREPEAQPVVLVADVDEAAERESERDPEGRPAEGLPDGDDVDLPVEDAQVEREKREDEKDEAGIHPEHVEAPFEVPRQANAPGRPDIPGPRPGRRGGAGLVHPLRLGGAREHSPSAGPGLPRPRRGRSAWRRPRRRAEGPRRDEDPGRLRGRDEHRFDRRRPLLHRDASGPDGRGARDHRLQTS